MFKQDSEGYYRKKSRDASLMRDRIKDTLPLIEEEKKALAPGYSTLGPLDYKTVALTTSPPSVPPYFIYQTCS